MGAIKTVTVKKTLLFDNDGQEGETRQRQINLLGLKGMKVFTVKDHIREGYKHSLPAVYLEGYALDSHENGEKKAIVTMLSKSPEMLECLIKAKAELPADSETRKEIEALLKEIID